MQATETLRREHDQIENVLDLLESQLRTPWDHCPENWPFARWVVEFIADFADATHHAKEEDVLFPLLESRGIPRDGGPIGCMLHEHEIGRRCVAEMRSAIELQDAQAFYEAAREYVSLLRQHIFKENNVLFRMAEQCLTQGDDQAIVAGYTAADRVADRQTHAERFARQLAQWREKLGNIGAPAGQD